MKEGYKEKAESTFRGTQVVTSEEEKKYPGSAIGKQTFIENYVQQIVTTWVSELERFSSIAITQPHAAFEAFTHGLTNRCTYLARTTSNLVELIKPLKETIQKAFLPNLTSQNAFNDTKRNLLALTAHLGGLSILNTCMQDVCGTLLHLSENLNPPCMPDLRSVRDIYT